VQFKHTQDVDKKSPEMTPWLPHPEGCGLPDHRGHARLQPPPNTAPQSRHPLAITLLLYSAFLLRQMPMCMSFQHQNLRKYWAGTEVSPTVGPHYNRTHPTSDRQTSTPVRLDTRRLTACWLRDGTGPVAAPTEKHRSWRRLLGPSWACALQQFGGLSAAPHCTTPSGFPYPL